MTTERELLEMAAKACGYPEYRSIGIQLFEVKSHPTWPWVIWNPNHDDGDCARMEGALGIELTWFFDRVDALACDVAPVVEYFKDHAGDKNAARRAASVAVASEIGRYEMTQEQSLNTQLANAVAAVAAAQDYLGRMCEFSANARRDETNARNKVNEAQKHFDELVALVKKSAPRDTDWSLVARAALGES